MLNTVKIFENLKKKNLTPSRGSNHWPTLHALDSQILSPTAILNGRGGREQVSKHFIFSLFFAIQIMEKVKDSQCGNVIIFVSLTFYVKSILRIHEEQISHFNAFRGPEFRYLWIFTLFKGWNLPNEQNSQPLKWQKRQFLYFYNPQNWFHVKSEW